MALFNESLVGRFNLAIRKLHSMKGGAPAPQVSPELVHAIILENDRPEFHHLAGSTRYSTLLVTATPGGGFFSEVEFLNPAGGLLVVFEGIWLLALATAQTYKLTSFPAALGGSVGNGSPLDTREGTTKLSALQNRLSATLGAAISGIAQDQQAVPANDENVLIPASQGLILAPNTRIGIGNITAAQPTELVAIWRERPLEDSET